MAEDRPDVLVIGGGVIGMACAHEISQRGASVTVIDKGDFGQGCSYGNAGWITPCFALPLPMPGMFLKSIGWLMNPDSPLYIKPEPSILLARWLARFLLSMNRRRMLESVRALTEISKVSLDMYSKLADRTDNSFSFERKGLLLIAQSPAGHRYAVQEKELVGAHGIDGVEMTGDDLRTLEPALTGRVEGGVYFPDEAHAEPLAVVQAFKESAVRNGAKLLPRAEVIDFQMSGGRIESVRTTRGVFKADRFVLATGAWSNVIAKSLRLRIPVLGGKGYAIISEPITPAPTRPMMLVEKKVAVTPRKGSLRLAGTLELVNRDDSITARRVDVIVRGAREFLNVPDPVRYTEIWRGLRPCTPDGVPVIGFSKEFGNLLIATGHQMLGLQSAPGTGRLVADLVTGSTPSFDPHPFRATRF